MESESSKSDELDWNDHVRRNGTSDATEKNEGEEIVMFEKLW